MSTSKKNAKELKKFVKACGCFSFFLFSSFGLGNSLSTWMALEDTRSYYEDQQQEMLDSLRLSTEEIAEVAEEFDVSKELVEKKVNEIIEEVESTVANLEPPSTGSDSFSFQKPSFETKSYSTFRRVPPVMQATLKLDDFYGEIQRLEKSIKTLGDKIWWASWILRTISKILYTALNASLLKGMSIFIAKITIGKLLRWVFGFSITFIEEFFGLTEITDEALATILSKVAYTKKIWLAKNIPPVLEERMTKMKSLAEQAASVVEEFYKEHQHEWCPECGNTAEHWNVLFKVFDLWEEFQKSKVIVETEIAFLNEG